jgi:hypothetical protein
MIKESFKWVSQEKRKVERPRQGWRDDIKKAMNPRDLAEESCFRSKTCRLEAEKR